MKLNKIDMNTKDQFLLKYDALTVGDFKSLIEEFKLSEHKCLNSNFTKEYTLKLVNEQKFENFNPITGAYYDCGVTFVNEFNKYTDCAKTASSLIKILNDTLSNDVPDDIKIERDVDEGYRFESYESVLITKTHLIFF